MDKDIFDLNNSELIERNVRKLKEQFNDLSLKEFKTKQDVSFALEDVNNIRKLADELMLDLTHIGMWGVE